MAERKQPDTIGSKLLVDFPDLNLTAVPTKVDTGADSSAIWASNIRKENGKLRFVLFDRRSPFYTGELLTADRFLVASVRNSFGQVEHRYKVKLRVVIAGRKIRANFTLADRSSNHYPVLLGRRLLKNKFIVDVSQESHRLAHTPSILILSAPTPGMAEFAQGVAQAMKSGAKVVAAQYDELVFYLAQERPKIALGRHDLAEFDLIYFKNHERAYPAAAAAASYAVYCGIPFVDQELSQHVSFDKLSEALKLAADGLPIIPSICAHHSRLAQYVDAAIQQWGLPLVCKEIRSARGHKNFLMRTKDEIYEMIEGADADDYFMLQKYIHNQGYLRLLVLGQNVALVTARTPVRHQNPQKDHLNNPSGSANASLLLPETIPLEVHQLAIETAEAMQRQVAGVDLIQDADTKAWYILEVNHAPQIVGGAFPDEKRAAFARFFDKELER